MRTVERDAEVASALQGAGWTVMRVWERDVLRDIEGIADRVEQLLTDLLPRVVEPFGFHDAYTRELSR